jgi:hypothetical protein
MIELYPIFSGDVQNLGNTKTKLVRSKTQKLGISKINNTYTLKLLTKN